MPVQIAIPKETQTGEKRVAMTPRVGERLVKLGVSLRFEPGAGLESGALDSDYSKFAELAVSQSQLYSESAIVLRVQVPEPGQLELMAEGSVLISFVYSGLHIDQVRLLRDRKVTCFAMELVPRISRAQNVDALSSQAMAAGYKAALLAAGRFERFFPMLTTAAGTIRPAKVLIVGAGVAGLQAIATARRLGAQVEGYDVRTASREEVESLGAKFISAPIRAEAAGGYARELTADERRAQQELLAQHVSQADIVICAANIPGRPAPRILSKTMVESMKPGSVIVDLAAETGGNCELTSPGQEIMHGRIIILGPLNIPSLIAQDASQMYAQNLYNFLALFLKNGEIHFDWDDEIIAKTALTHQGEIKNEPARRLVEGASQ